MESAQRTDDLSGLEHGDRKGLLRVLHAVLQKQETQNQQRTLLASERLSEEGRRGQTKGRKTGASIPDKATHSSVNDEI
jgi:hypothetical protein